MLQLVSGDVALVCYCPVLRYPLIRRVGVRDTLRVSVERLPRPCGRPRCRILCWRCASPFKAHCAARRYTTSCSWSPLREFRARHATRALHVIGADRCRILVHRRHRQLTLFSLLVCSLWIIQGMHFDAPSKETRGCAMHANSARAWFTCGLSCDAEIGACRHCTQYPTINRAARSCSRMKRIRATSFARAYRTMQVD